MSSAITLERGNAFLWTASRQAVWIWVDSLVSMPLPLETNFTPGIVGPKLAVGFIDDLNDVILELRIIDLWGEESAGSTVTVLVLYNIGFESLGELIIFLSKNN